MGLQGMYIFLVSLSFLPFFALHVLLLYMLSQDWKQTQKVYLDYLIVSEHVM